MRLVPLLTIEWNKGARSGVCETLIQSQIQCQRTQEVVVGVGFQEGKTPGSCPWSQEVPIQGQWLFHHLAIPCCSDYRFYQKTRIGGLQDEECIPCTRQTPTSEAQCVYPVLFFLFPPQPIGLQQDRVVRTSPAPCTFSRRLTREPVRFESWFHNILSA